MHWTWTRINSKKNPVFLFCDDMGVKEKISYPVTKKIADISQSPKELYILKFIGLKSILDLHIKSD